MKQKDKNLIVALDINTSSIKSILGCVEVGKKEKPPFFDLYGTHTKSSGINHIGITNKKNFSESIEKAITSLKNFTGFEIENVHILYTHPSIEHFKKIKKIKNNNGEYGIQITKKWIENEKKTIERKIESNYPHKKCINITMTSIIADGEEIIHDPYDFQFFDKVLIKFIFILVQESFFDALQECAEKSTSIENIFPSILSHANRISDEEKNEGIIICDIGYLYTGIAGYKDGFLQNLSIIGFGGYDIIKQIVTMEKISLSKAKEIKESIYSDKSILTQTKIKSLNAKISAEIKKILLPEFKNINAKEIYIHGILLTGDTALYPGMDTMLKKIIGMHVSTDHNDIHIQSHNDIHIQSGKNEHNTIWSAPYGYLCGLVKKENYNINEISSSNGGFLHWLAKSINNFSRNFH